MSRTFPGGIHPEYHKEETSGQSVVALPPPAKLIFPVLQHVGAPCVPVVNVGDEVKLGQLLADSSAPISSPVHSSVSGKVIAIEPRPHPGGAQVLSIVVENDFNDTPDPSRHACSKKIEELTPDEIVAMVRDAGIVGMGGAGFPANVKIRSALGKIDTLLGNGAECEPYLSSDHRLMLEYPEFILGGAKILMHCFGQKKMTLCIEDNKEDAIEKFLSLTKGDPSIRIAELKTKYPQGGEKQIIKAVTGREVPRGKLPADAKCVVFNVDSIASIYRAYRFGTPVYQRFITLAGSAIAEPRVLLARIGTPFSEVLKAVGGFSTPPKKVLMGGPMMGIAQHTLDVPVTKTTSGILAFTDEEDHDVAEPSCIRCGRCLKACPMHLMPVYMSAFYHKGDMKACEEYNVMDCIECGSCAYECPGRLNLVTEFRVCKMKINEARRQAAALRQAAENKG